MERYFRRRSSNFSCEVENLSILATIALVAALCILVVRGSRLRPIIQKPIVTNRDLIRSERADALLHPVHYPPEAVPHTEIEKWEPATEAPELYYAGIAGGKQLIPHGRVFPDGSQRAALFTTFMGIPIRLVDRYAVRVIGIGHYQFLAVRKRNS